MRTGAGHEKHGDVAVGFLGQGQLQEGEGLESCRGVVAGGAGEDRLELAREERHHDGQLALQVVAPPNVRQLPVRPAVAGLIFKK